MDGGGGAGIGNMIADISATAFDQTMANMWSANSMMAQNKHFRKNMNYQKNRYQYTVRDLKRAGLNPLLAVGGMQGGGNVTATGGVSHGSTPHSFAMGAAAVQSAKNQARNLEKQGDLMESEKFVQDQKRHTEAEMQLWYQADAEKKRHETDLVDLQMVKTFLESKSESAFANKLNAETLGQLYENYKQEAQKSLYKGKTGKVVGFLDWLLGKVPLLNK